MERQRTVQIVGGHGISLGGARTDDAVPHPRVHHLPDGATPRSSEPGGKLLHAPRVVLPSPLLGGLSRAPVVSLLRDVTNLLLLLLCL